MLGPWRCHWTQTAYSAQFGGEFCPHFTGPLRSKHFQQNESYFHILNINWDWMDYVTSVELFIDLKPRICEVCTCKNQNDKNMASLVLRFQDWVNLSLFLFALVSSKLRESQHEKAILRLGISQRSVAIMKNTIFQNLIRKLKKLTLQHSAFSSIP